MGQPLIVERSPAPPRMLCDGGHVLASGWWALYRRGNQVEREPVAAFCVYSLANRPQYRGFAGVLALECGHGEPRWADREPGFLRYERRAGLVGALLR